MRVLKYRYLNNEVKKCQLFSWAYAEHFSGAGKPFLLDRAKDFLTPFKPKKYSNFDSFYIEFHKSQIAGLGNCLVLPIGADTHGCFVVLTVSAICPIYYT